MTRPAGETIRTRTAFDRIVPIAAVDGVGPVAANKPVVERVAREGVTESRAQDLLEARDRVALRVSAGHHAGGQVDRDPGVRPLVGEAVGAGTPNQAVGARTAFDGVVPAAGVDGVCARPPTEPVVASGSDQAVVEARAEDFLEVGLEAARGVRIGQHIPLRMAAGHHAGGQIDRDPGIRPLVREAVRAGTPSQAVGARTAFDGVVPVSAEQRVGVAAPHQVVAVGRAEDFLEVGLEPRKRRVRIGQHVPLRMAAGHHPRRQAHRDRCPRPLVGEPVRPRPAGQRVRVGAALDGVGAATTEQAIRSSRSLQAVRIAVARQRVRVVGPEHPLEVGRSAQPRIRVVELIELSMTAGNREGREVDGDPGVRARIRELIRPSPTGQRIPASTTHDGVVALTATEGIDPAKTTDEIVAPKTVDQVVRTRAREGVVTTRRCRRHSAYPPRGQSSDKPTHSLPCRPPRSEDAEPKGRESEPTPHSDGTTIQDYRGQLNRPGNPGE